jgi:hypothetical protein
MTLHSSQIAGGGAATLATLKSTTEHKKSTSASFSKALKDASSTTDTSSSSTTTADTTAKAPSGEKATAVDGHKYSTITAGPRKGMFLNTGTNDRSGEAFVMVRKNGREYHIYGTGSHREVIGMKTTAEKQATDTSSTTDTSATDTTTSTGTTGTTDTGKINTDTSTTS